MPAPTDQQTAKPLVYCNRSIIAWQASAKRQTRRLVRPQPEGKLLLKTGRPTWVVPRWYDVLQTPGKLSMTLFEPSPKPYAVGDLLWIREALKRGPNNQVLYQADSIMAGTAVIVPIWDWKRKKLPAMFMPRWACRYYARVTSVRPERLQDITEDDAYAEGTHEGLDLVIIGNWYDRGGRDLYLEWWDSMHRKPGTRSEDNPWIWRYVLEPVDIPN